MLEQLACDFATSVLVVMVDIDQNPELAKKFVLR